MQEHDTVGVFGGVQMDVGDALDHLRQHRELEVVRGEQGPGALLARQPCGRRPRERKPVEGAGATPDLIHQHQALCGGVVQDGGRLGHFHHEGGAPAGKIIRGPDAREDAVEERNLSARCGHVTAHVRKQCNQCHLPHVGGLTAHVRPGDDQHPPCRIEFEVVGDERRGGHALHHRMPASAYPHGRAGAEFRAAVVKRCRALGERREHIELRQRCRAVL